MVGGMAKNEGFLDSFKKNIEMDVLVPEDPDYMGALGAAEAAIAGAYTEEQSS
jgi:activator of 2-hydroxyglutaryl-CoA dehydratase